jgi:hypothetical protein
MGDGNTGRAGDATVQPLVVRPSRGGSASRAQLVAAGGWILAALLYSLRFHGMSRVVVIAIAVAFGVGVVVWTRLSRVRMKLTLHGGRLIVSGVLRDRLVSIEGREGRVVQVEVKWQRAAPRRSRLWLLTTASGRTEIGLNRDAWDGQQLERLRESLGLPVEVVPAPMRPAELRRDYPHSIPWWAARPALATLLAIVLLATLLVALEHLAR